VEACCHERSYRKQYGVMAERLCKLSTDYETCFDALFQRQYGSVHQLDTNKIRNVAKLMAHLLCSDALDWTVLQCLKLNDRDTNPSKRIFVKILFQEMASFLGKTLKKRLLVMMTTMKPETILNLLLNPYLSLDLQAVLNPLTL